MLNLKDVQVWVLYPKTPCMQIVPIFRSKVYKYYLLWAIWSLRVRVSLELALGLRLSVRAVGWSSGQGVRSYALRFGVWKGLGFGCFCRFRVKGLGFRALNFRV